MMKMFILLFLVAVATLLSGVDAWGEESHDDWWELCPHPEANSKYSEECYKATIPPPFVCKHMKPDEWVEKALDSYPRCCVDDLSACKCPVKNWWPPFKARIGDYCAKVEICKPSVRSGTSGDVPYLRGGVEDVNKQTQRIELSP
jgi:hypothetical protein